MKRLGTRGWKRGQWSLVCRRN